MNEWLVAALLVLGAGTMLLAAVGIVRFPDFYTRMHAAAKAGTLGKICLVLAVMLHFVESDVSIRAVLVIAFFSLSAPVAAHLISRAAYRMGVPLWARSVTDEWADRPDAPRPPSDGGGR